MCAFYKEEKMRCKEMFDKEYTKNSDLLTEKQKGDRQMELMSQSQTIKSLVD